MARKLDAHALPARLGIEAALRAAFIIADRA